MSTLRSIEPFASNHKFLGLDGLRGLCAIAVVLRHVEDLTGRMMLPSASMAVDMFFIMSGFVIVQAYEQKLASGMTAARFMTVRMIRLYPLYIFGTLVAALTILAALVAGVRLDAWTPILLVEATVPALAMLPVHLDAFDALYPINPPAWSLFFELIANALFAVALYRVSNRTLLWLVAGAACVIMASAVGTSTLDGGAQWRNVGIGLARVMFGFPMGMLIYRLYRSGSLRSPVVPLPVVLFVAVAMMAFRPGAPAMVALWDVVGVVVISPAIVVLCIGNETARFPAVFGFLGFVSYPVYMSHVFVYHSARRTLIIAQQYGISVPAPWGGVAVVVASVIFAWFLGRYFDAPVRSWIGGLLQRREQRIATR